jgi:hypothetical protein
MGWALNAESMVTVAVLESHQNRNFSLQCQPWPGASGLGQSPVASVALGMYLAGAASMAGAWIVGVLRTRMTEFRFSAKESDGRLNMGKAADSDNCRLSWSGRSKTSSEQRKSNGEKYSILNAKIMHSLYRFQHCSPEPKI